MKTYKFSDILEINTNLTKLKQLGKEFPFTLSKLLSDNLYKTNKIIEEHNIKLNELSEEFGIVGDSGELVITGEGLTLFNKKVQELYEEEFSNIENIYMREVKFKDEFKNLYVNIEIIDLLKLIIVN